MTDFFEEDESLTDMVKAWTEGKGGYTLGAKKLTGEQEQRLESTVDAMAWAQEFCQAVRDGAVVDEGFVVGWFANAIETAKNEKSEVAAAEDVRLHAAENVAKELHEPTGIELIAAERKRQIEVEGYTVEHDLLHKEEDLGKAAAAYILYDETLWPWDKELFKPGGTVEQLTKAGALVAADIDRHKAAVAKIRDSGWPWHRKK